MKSAWLWPASAFCLYAALYFLLLFQPGLLQMDDFGYLQSVAESVAAGRILTHDWLGPYNAPLTTLGVAVYKLSGDFILATWGLQAVLALANFALLLKLLRMRLPPAPSAALALALATHPFYWYRCSEYAGNLLTLTFTLLALLAYLRGRWVLFFLAAFLAFANRQNGLALLALPAFHILESKREDWRRGAGLAAGMAAFLAAGWLLHGGMNETVSQTHDVYAGLGLSRLAAYARTGLIGAFAALTLLSFLDALLGGDPRRNLRDNLKRPALPALGTLIAVVLWAWAPQPYFHALTSLFAYAVGPVLNLGLTVLACLCLWILDWKLPRWSPAFGLVAAYILLSSLRGFWYDLYLVDIALATLFYLLARRPSLSKGKPLGKGFPAGKGFPLGLGKSGLAVLLLFLSGHLAWAGIFKIVADKQRTTNRAYELLERRGKLGVEEMSEATFGYQGWKLFDHYKDHGNLEDLSYFQCYVGKGKVVVETELPWRRAYRRELPPEARVLEEGWTRLGYFRVRYRVVRNGEGGWEPVCADMFKSLEGENYRWKAFPLTRREWSEYIADLPSVP